MATTTATWTFPDDATRDDYWQKYCNFYRISYADAAEAETNALAEIKNQAALVYANQVAITDGDAAREASYTSNFADASGY